MAIKGKSVIELYNPNTRIKQRYEDENIVTNVFKYLFGQNYFAQAGTGFMNKFLPLYKNGIGGIILFDSQIEENPDIVIAPSTVGCTGYASTGAYSGSDLSRGGMNVNETSLIDNGMKFVWDFATSQANGDIACVSLTHANGGRIGYGSKNYGDSGNTNISWFVNLSLDFYGNGNYSTCIVDDTLYYASTVSVNEIVLEKHKIFLKEIGLRNSYTTTKKIGEKRTTISSISYVQKPVFCVDNRKAYLVIDYNRILDVTDFDDIKEYSLPVNAASLRQMVVRNNYIYLGAASRNIEKYSISDTSAKLNEITVNSALNADGIKNINGYIILNNTTMLDENDNLRIIYMKGDEYYLRYTPGQLYNPVFIPHTVDTSSGTRIMIGCEIAPNYLATINNLKVPITKTSAQTMKITYTLTEE